MFSVVICKVAVSKSNTISVLKPGFSFIFISDFRTPRSTSNSFATFRTMSIACSLVKSSGKFSRRALIISSPRKPCSDFSRMKAS